MMFFLLVLTQLCAFGLMYAPQYRSDVRANVMQRLSLGPTSGVNTTTSGYAIDDLRLRSNHVRSLVPPGMDPTLSKAEQAVIKRKEEAQSQGEEGKSDMDILKEELARMLDNF